MRNLAFQNLEDLRQNVYPGRGIICGMDETGQYIVQIYWIMGRSENSRNRVFVFDEINGTVKTEAANPELVKDASLIIYTAMAEKNLRYVVSNGHQTLSVANGSVNRGILPLTKIWSYEDDAPNFTPRITASVFLGENDDSGYSAEIAVFKKEDKSNVCLKSSYVANLEPKFGHCITTYDGDGNPLPSFSKDPYLLPLLGDIEQITDTIWDALNEDNRISLVVKFIDIHTGKSQLNVINKYEQVLAEN